MCDLDERSVSLGVMSKSFGLAGLRIGWLATRNRELYQKLAAFKDYTTICNSAPSEYLATLTLKHKEHLLARNLRLIQQNLQTLDAFFARHADRFAWDRPKAGPIAFPRYLGGEGTERFCHELVTRAGVLLLPSSLYDYGDHHFRIGFGRKNLYECVLKLDEGMVGFETGRPGGLGLPGRGGAEVCRPAKVIPAALRQRRPHRKRRLVPASARRPGQKSPIGTTRLGPGSVTRLPPHYHCRTR